MTTPAASIPLAVQALLTCLKKCGAMDNANRERLRRRIERHGVLDLPGLRTFLQNGGVQPVVAGTLIAMLPPEDDLVIGGCHLLAHLANGGMGTVWLAGYDGALVVLKTLKRELARDLEYLKRFDREADITARLDHPHVVRCLGHGTDRGLAYLCLEFVPGGDLETLIQHRGYLEEADALNITLQTSRGLAHAWEQNLVHRDIKPANLFIDGKGRVKVADFGLARSTLADASVLTKPGMTMGSPAYMAPEQIRAKTLDCRTDIYACGCVLYQCLTGVPPFDGSLQDIIAGHLSGAAPDVRLINPKTTAATATLIRRCLEKKPDARYASPEAFAEALATILRDLGGNPEANLSRSIVYASTAVMPAIEIDDLPEDHTAVRAPAADDDHDPPPLPAPGLRKRQSTSSMKIKRKGDDDPAAVFANAVQGPRLTLEAGDILVLLLAQESAVLGKLMVPPVDVAIRDYPAEQFALSSGRVSRQHCRIGLDGRLVTITDLGSANGTEVDGRLLASGEARALVPFREHAVEIRDSVALSVRAIPCRTEAVTTIPNLPASKSGPGLASTALWDAVVIRRPRNRPGLAYALVPRRILLGPATADIPLPGWRGEAVEIAPWNGAWIWRKAREAWAPLAPGTLGGFHARAGDREDCR